ncbi:hypothetical protein GCK32_002588 [Trichostrongylus colubriformis]|uniref:Uncharacterized protein n=1 Tax=Trichostrongylus colubriformis TaxID=6319 RepID=A0AAN8EUG6_TRICO
MFIILPFLFLEISADVPEPDWSSFSLFTPATTREGNRYYIDVDNIGNERIHKPIAAALINKKVVFGTYDESKGCAYFPNMLSGSYNFCGNKFFLLHQNHRYLARRSLQEIVNDKNCSPLIGERYVVLVKRDMTNFNSEKFIGTYSKAMDRLVYHDAKQDKVTHNDVMAKFGNGKLNTKQFESLCVVGYL